MDTARRSALARPGAGRLLVLACLVTLTLLAWAYLWLLAERMDSGDMSLMGMSGMPLVWTGRTFLLMTLMWWVMMIGMMIPSALPAILLHARVQRHHRDNAREITQLSLLFAFGYLVAWALFSLVATVSQWVLTTAGWLAPMTMSVGKIAGAALFALAGIYQLTPLKAACLRHCRSPVEFLAGHHRPGLSGAFITGAHHGIYCVGCCWLIMGLLFAGGVMNLLWVFVLAMLVLIEKLLPYGQRTARIGGILMLAAAAYLTISG